MSASPDERLLTELGDAFDEIFGQRQAPIEEVARRAERLLSRYRYMVWECAAANVEFIYVSESAEKLLGYPRARWLQPGFWQSEVLHPNDRDEAVAYCALATLQRRDHEFEYRARAADGSPRWIYDVVRVVFDPGGMPVRLRGIMLDVTDLKRRAGEMDSRAWRRYPMLEKPAAPGERGADDSR